MSRRIVYVSPNTPVSDNYFRSETAVKPAEGRPLRALSPSNKPARRCAVGGYPRSCLPPDIRVGGQPASRAAGRGAAAERRRVIVTSCAAPHSRRALSPAQKVLDNDQQSRAPHSRRARPRPQSGGPRGRLRTRGSDGGGGPLRVGQMHSGTGRARLCCARFAGPCRPAIRMATLHGDDGTKPRNPAPPPPRRRGRFEIAHLAL